MQLNRVKKKFLTAKILGGIVLSYLSVFLIKDFFIEGTPMVRSNPMRVFNEKLLSVKNYFLGIDKISTGVYSKEKNGVREITINTGEIEWDSYDYQVDGKTITVKVRKGEPPPSADVIK